MSALSDYLQRSDAESVLLMEIVCGGLTYYLSDRPYRTSSTDTPANLQFTPILDSRSLPRLHRGVADPLVDQPAKTYGSVSITARQAVARTSDGTQVAADLNLFVGCAVTIKRSGPFQLFPYSVAITVATGSIEKISGRHDSGFDLTVIAQPTLLDRQNVAPEQFFYSPDTFSTILGPVEAPSFYGRTRHVVPYQPDPSHLVYFLHGVWGVAPINTTFGSGNWTSLHPNNHSIQAVYDNGVLLSFPSQWTTLDNDVIKLASTPVGPITVDLYGLYDSQTPGPRLETMQEVVTYLVGGAAATQFDSGVPTGDVGYAVTELDTKVNALDNIIRGCGLWWHYKRDGTFAVRLPPIATAGGREFSARDIFGDVSFETYERLIRRVEFQYQRCHHVFTPASGASNSVKEFVQKEWRTGSRTSAELGITKDASVDGPSWYAPVPWVFDTDSATTGAKYAAAQILTAFANRRWRVEFTVPYQDPPLDIGDSVKLTGFEPPINEKDVYILEVDDIFDGKTPRHLVRGLI